MSDNYELRESVYQNIWDDNWESDGTKKPNFQYDYYTNYELVSESAKELPQWISLHVYLDGWGIVQDALIQTVQYQNSESEIQEWGYDFLSDKQDYNTGTPCWNLETQIKYPRPSGYPALKSGSKGPKVGWVQTALNKAMSAYLDVDCNFGTGTDNKVREFQSRCGLGADGSVGPQTIAMLVDIVSGNKKMPEKIIVTESPQNEQKPGNPNQTYSPPVKQEMAQTFVVNIHTK